MELKLLLKLTLLFCLSRSNRTFMELKLRNLNPSAQSDLF